MSNSSRTDRLPLRTSLPSVPALREPLVGVAFWTAVALPFLHLPLLATGLETWDMRLAFLVLLALNVVTLLLGHSYRRA